MKVIKKPFTRHFYSRLLPSKFIQHCKDFLDTGVDPVDWSMFLQLTVQNHISATNDAVWSAMQDTQCYQHSQCYQQCIQYYQRAIWSLMYCRNYKYLWKIKPVKVSSIFVLKTLYYYKIVLFNCRCDRDLFICFKLFHVSLRLFDSKIFNVKNHLTHGPSKFNTFLIQLFVFVYIFSSPKLV